MLQQRNQTAKCRSTSRAKQVVNPFADAEHGGMHVARCIFSFPMLIKPSIIIPSKVWRAYIVSKEYQSNKMKGSLRHEKPPIHKTSGEAPRSKFDLDHRNSKETIKDQGVSSAAAANSPAFDPCKTRRNSAIDVRRELCEKIHAKMQFLEEDTRLMKEAILDCVEDRDMLMSEISHMLHMIREHLSISSECKLDCPPRVCSFDFDPLKHIGLLGVLHQDLTPTLVAQRAKKINVNAFDH